MQSGESEREGGRKLREVSRLSPALLESRLGLKHPFLSSRICETEAQEGGRDTDRGLVGVKKESGAHCES